METDIAFDSPMTETEFPYFCLSVKAGHDLFRPSFFHNGIISDALYDTAVSRYRFLDSLIPSHVQFDIRLAVDELFSKEELAQIIAVCGAKEPPQSLSEAGSLLGEALLNRLVNAVPVIPGRNKRKEGNG